MNNSRTNKEYQVKTAYVKEQPFTRSLSQLKIPIGVSEVIVRASDSKHGDGKHTFKLKLPPRM